VNTQGVRLGAAIWALPFDRRRSGAEAWVPDVWTLET